MSDKTKIKAMFAALQTKMLGDLGLSSIHDNNVARGDNSEVSWREMLSEHLPKRYKVDTGFVIDSDGNQSDAIDVIIYDSYYSPYVFNSNDVLYVPAESVYAVLECKQNLNKEHMEYAASKAASVRALKRTSLPVRQINGEMVAKKDIGIIAGLLTTTSDWKEPFGTSFTEAIASSLTTSPINFGCSLRNGSYRVEYKDTPIVTHSEEDEALITFFINLVTDLQSLGNAPAIDLGAYYKS